MSDKVSASAPHRDTEPRRDSSSCWFNTRPRSRSYSAAFGIFHCDLHLIMSLQPISASTSGVSLVGTSACFSLDNSTTAAYELLRRHGSLLVDWHYESSSSNDRLEEDDGADEVGYGKVCPMRTSALM